jgi:hypothetical protein
MMDEGRILARRPPLTSLLKAAVLIAMAALAIFGIIAIITSEKNFLDPQFAGIFWVFVIFIGILGVFGLWMLALFIRQVSRWVISGAGVYSGAGGFRFGIPRTQAWWNPLLKVEDKEVQLTAVHGTHFNTSDKSTLMVETEDKKIEIPSGVFSTGGYTLDYRIRELVGGMLRPVKPEKIWSASLGIRIVMIVIGLLLIAFFVAMAQTIQAGSDSAKGLTPFFIGGIAFFLLSLVHRGRVVVDVRGLFYERNGKVSFISWEALEKGKVKYHREMLTLGLWSDLLIESASKFTRKADFRLRLTRIAGLGFPLRKIEEMLMSRLSELKGGNDLPPEN